MKLLRLRLLFLLLAASPLAKSQSGELTGALGIASYYVDLVHSNPFFREPGYAISFGGKYNFNGHWAWRGELFSEWVSNIIILPPLTATAIRSI